MPAEMTPRRFPAPWTVEETDACFIVRDVNGQARAYVYGEDEPGRRLGRNGRSFGSHRACTAATCRW